MAKLVLDDVSNITGNETSAISTINNNSAAIETALENTLSRDGTSPNTMNTDIDLNDNDLLNVGSIDVTSLIVAGTELFPDSVTALGNNGWSPVFAIASSGAARVLQLVAYVGGEGTAPTTYINQYVGASGMTATIGDAVDIRGPAGAGTGDMLAANNLSDVASASTSFTNIKQASSETATGVVELATNAEVQTGSDTARAVTPAGLNSVGYAKLATEDQTVSGGARVTVKNLGNLTGASITPDPGDRPIQKITNNGAGSILPGTNEGSYLLQVVNTTGAGAITTTGWTTKGDSFDTTTTSKFLCSCLVTSDIKLMSITKVV